MTEKRKALKQAKKNVAKQTEVEIDNDEDHSSGEESAQGILTLNYLHLIYLSRFYYSLDYMWLAISSSSFT